MIAKIVTRTEGLKYQKADKVMEEYFNLLYFWITELSVVVAYEN